MSSKRRIRRKQCTGKQQFPTAADGLFALHQLKRRTGSTDFYNVYKCQFCKKFHFGHANKRYDIYAANF